MAVLMSGKWCAEVKGARGGVREGGLLLGEIGREESTFCGGVVCVNDEEIGTDRGGGRERGGNCCGRERSAAGALVGNGGLMPGGDVCWVV